MVVGYHPVAHVEVSVHHEELAVAVANSFSHLSEDAMENNLRNSVIEHLSLEYSLVQVHAVDELHDHGVSVIIASSIHLDGLNTVRVVEQFEGLSLRFKSRFHSDSREDLAHVNSLVTAVSFLNSVGLSAAAFSE